MVILSNVNNPGFKILYNYQRYIKKIRKMR